MSARRFMGLAAVAGGGLTAHALTADAQVSIHVGVAPACPYSYYDVASYSCAPTGYYGPEWFSGGERADPGKRVTSAHFRGNERRGDGRGHVMGGRR